MKEKKPKVNLAAIRMKEMQDLGRKQIAVNVIKKILGGGNSKTLFSLKNNLKNILPFSTTLNHRIDVIDRKNMQLKYACGVFLYRR